ncbi:hypothetical protein LCGC14_2199730, partial [marine sediment metagenome]
AQRPALRVAVRATLTPVVYMVQYPLMGMALVIGVGAGAGATGAGVARRRRRRRRKA